LVVYHIWDDLKRKENLEAHLIVEPNDTRALLYRYKTQSHRESTFAKSHKNLSKRAWDLLEKNQALNIEKVFFPTGELEAIWSMWVDGWDSQ
jgi:hypothetical protein